MLINGPTRVVRRLTVRLARDPLPVRLVYMIGGCAVVAIAPMIVARLLTADYPMVAIDALVLIGLLIPTVCCWRTGRVRAAKIFLGVTAVAGALAITWMRGEQSLYWIYPALVSAFFVMTPREALALGLVAGPPVVVLASADLDGMAIANLSITLALVELFGYTFSVQMDARHGRLHDLAWRDALTNLRNRRALDHAFTAERRVHANASALLVLDLDHFKGINDRYGHAAGDRLLRRCAGVLRNTLRAGDDIFRFGGEEFVVILPHIKLEQAGLLAEKLRCAISEALSGECGEVTVSIGYAELAPEETWHTCLARADAALYNAKRAGRNRTYKAEAWVRLAALAD